MNNTYYDKVVGVTFEGRQETIKNLRRGDLISLIPEPENKYDPKAIRVESAGKILGYVQKNGWLQEAINEKNAKFNAEVYEISGGGKFSYGVVMKLTPVVNEKEQ